MFAEEEAAAPVILVTRKKLVTKLVNGETLCPNWMDEVDKGFATQPNFHKCLVYKDICIPQIICGVESDGTDLQYFKDMLEAEITFEEVPAAAAILTSWYKKWCVVQHHGNDWECRPGVQALISCTRSAFR